MALFRSGLQVTSWPDSCEVAFRAKRALKSLVAARTSLNSDLKHDAEKALCKALRPTTFGQAFDLATVQRLVERAQLLECLVDETRILQGEDDGMYVVLTGDLQLLRISGGKSLKVTIESARDLLGDSERDRLDPYVIVKVGSKRFQTEIMTDAGSNPVFNFSQTIDYDGEEEIEFWVMEYDEYSKDDSIAVGAIHVRHFADGFKGEIELQQPTKRKTQSGKKPELAGLMNINIEWIAPQDDFQSTLPKGKLTNASTADLMSRLDSGGVDQDLETSPGLDLAPATPRVTQRKSRRDTTMVESGSEVGSKSGSKSSVGYVGPDSAGRTLQSGEFFGEESGGQILCVTDCILMFVPRPWVISAFKNVRVEQSKEKDAFLRRWLPGAATVEDRVFEAFSATFQWGAFPRGHVFCSEGQHTTGRRVYLIKKGECRVNMSHEATLKGCKRPTTEGSPIGIRRTMDSGHASQPNNQNQFGIVGEGQLLGYASALFGIPEPFTANAINEAVEAYWINVSQRPTSTWPREVVKPLMAVLRMRVTYHEKRKQRLVDNEPKLDISDSDARDCDQLCASVRSSGALIKNRGRNIDKGLTASPFLRNKDTSSWKLQAITDRFTEWFPGDAKRTAQPVKSTSLPNLHSQESLSLRPHTSQSFQSTSQSRRATSRRQPNLYCPSDWASMSAVASTTAISKMYKQQARLGSSSGFRETWGS